MWGGIVLAVGQWKLIRTCGLHGVSHGLGICDVIPKTCLTNWEEGIASPILQKTKLRLRMLMGLVQSC